MSISSSSSKGQQQQNALPPKPSFLPPAPPPVCSLSPLPPGILGENNNNEESETNKSNAGDSNNKQLAVKQKFETNPSEWIEWVEEELARKKQKKQETSSNNSSNLSNATGSDSGIVTGGEGSINGEHDDDFLEDRDEKEEGGRGAGEEEESSSSEWEWEESEDVEEEDEKKEETVTDEAVKVATPAQDEYEADLEVKLKKDGKDWEDEEYEEYEEYEEEEACDCEEEKEAGEESEVLLTVECDRKINSRPQSGEIQSNLDEIAKILAERESSSVNCNSVKPAVIDLPDHSDSQKSDQKAITGTAVTATEEQAEEEEGSSYEEYSDDEEEEEEDVKAVEEANRAEINPPANSDEADSIMISKEGGGGGDEEENATRSEIEIASSVSAVDDGVMEQGEEEDDRPSENNNNEAASVENITGRGEFEDEKEKGEDATAAKPAAEVSVRKSRLEHITGKVADQHLDDMLERIKKLREERKQILSDMSMLRSAMGEEELKEEEAEAERETEKQEEEGESVDATELDCTLTGEENKDSGQQQQQQSTTILEADKSLESGHQFPSDSNPTERSRSSSRRRGSSSSSAEVTSKVQSKKRIVAIDDSETKQDGIHCFICGTRLGRRLNIGSIMHMGLEDGDPICPEALYLTEASKDKVRNITGTVNLDVDKKFELLQTIQLTTTRDDDEEEGGAKEFLDRAESFLDDIEAQKDKDQEELQAIRDGLYEEQQQQQHQAVQPSEPEDQDKEEEVEGDYEDEDEYEYEYEEDEEDQCDDSVLPRKLPPDLCLEISRPPRPLSHSSCDDRSAPVEAGKVLNPLVSPDILDPDRRQLMRQISAPAGLKKVRTHDRSAPYIPSDTEIYFYAGPPKNLKPGEKPSASWRKERYVGDVY